MMLYTATSEGLVLFKDIPASSLYGRLPAGACVLEDWPPESNLPEKDCTVLFRANGKTIIVTAKEVTQ